MTAHIISFSGLIGSGKDAAAQYLIDNHGFTRVSFASTLKDAVAAVFGWDRILLDGVTAESRGWRESVDTWWSKRLDMPYLTPRWVLQFWGTDVLRQHFHQDIWVASVEYQLQRSDYDVVITDARFYNEIQAIKSTGGTTVHMLRGPIPEWYEHAINYNRGENTIGYALSKQALAQSGIHPSEYSHIGIPYDVTIENNGTISDLHGKIKDLVVDRQVAR